MVNTSATVPGQLDGRRGADPVVVHVANRLPDGSRVVELRSAPRAAEPVLDGRAGEVIELPAGGQVELLAAYPEPGSSPSGSGNRLWRGRVRVAGSPADFLCRHARPISYGYLDRSYPIESYQTIFALHPGSAEMPSAGRPFSPELATRLVAGGVVIAPITLHTGVSSQEVGEAPQEEWFSVPAATAALVNDARRRGGRVVAVGHDRDPGSGVGRRVRRHGPVCLRVDRPGHLPGPAGARRVGLDHRLARSRRLPPPPGGVRRRARAVTTGVRRRRGRGLPVARVRRLGTPAALANLP